MIYNVFEDGKNQNSIKQTYLDYLIQIELLNYLNRLKLIDNNTYSNAKVEIEKSHIGK